MRVSGLIILFSPYTGRTALHITAGEGYMDVVQLLLSYGADVNAEDNLGEK